MPDENQLLDTRAILPSFTRAGQLETMSNKNWLISNSQKKHFRNMPHLVKELNWSSTCLICQFLLIRNKIIKFFTKSQGNYFDRRNASVSG